MSLRNGLPYFLKEQLCQVIFKCSVTWTADHCQSISKCVFLCTAVECNGGLAEEPDVVRDSTADQEVPHPEVLPEQTSGDFDFNEFFNLEKTMPGLASVSTWGALQDWCFRLVGHCQVL